jgi:hypothetical protein
MAESEETFTEDEKEVFRLAAALGDRTFEETYVGVKVFGATHCLEVLRKKQRGRAEKRPL